MTRILRAALVALALLVAPRAVAAQGFIVVANAANPLTSVSKSDAAMMFLKQKLTWPDGQRVVPVDLGKTSATRSAFTQQVLGRSVSAVTSYWQGQIFAGGAQPPAEKPSDAEVLAFVRANKGAIGYVSAGATIGDGVRAVTVK